ncbi:hypothetical protein IE81DRAFT_324779 [Ceraceosorus guamensis]|uniref:Uncharacterized protein n=1 Tax=Ceraceosorus guamensis TaxID=1522189 RepID=A0A316W0S6_9BASI|nr:hypothetical protein IE81DRAFT_324779 [Ceraceosorus guamensis]PWN41275.1 hypothetical protein IE81DRAFT_324779 [Ceraceosorus guamensis]
MACPVNHPAFHALIFVLGIIVVLFRHVKGAELPNASFMLAAAEATAGRAGGEAITQGPLAML